MNKKILISGAYGEANIGDDLLLHIILLWLRSENSNCKVIIASENMKYLKKLYSHIEIIPKAEADTFHSNLFILGGGTQFFSFKNQMDLQDRISFKKIFLNWLRNIIVFQKKTFLSVGLMKSKKKKIGLGVGLGPFEVYGTEVIAKSTISEYDFFYARDKFTKSLCEKFNVPSFLGADICLSDLFFNNFNFVHNRNVLLKEKIGIVLRDWPHNKNGSTINSKILEWVEVIKNKYDITFFLFSVEKDIDLKRILEEIPNTQIEIWNPVSDSFDNYLKKISFMDITITSRYHAAIFNLNFKIPTICLGIEPKLKHLVNEVKGFHYFDVKDEVMGLNGIVEGIFNSYQKVQEDIEICRLKLNDRANLMLDDASRYLKKYD